MPGCACSAACGRRSSARVKIGPSLAKIPLDALLTLTALRRALAGRYDAVHSHEEGGLIGVVLAALLRRAAPLRHALEPAAAARRTSRSAARALVRRVFLAIERLMIRRSRVVIVICPSLEETVRGDRSAARRPVLIENAPGSAEDAGDAGAGGRGPAQRSASAATTPIVLYTGHVRGVPGARSAVRRDGARARGAARRAAAAGRRQARSGRARARAGAAPPASATSTIFAGERPAAEIPAYLLAADVLVSPRSRGTNTPLKIYQYLRSGKPIVATRLLTHTQVLERRHGDPDRRRRRASSPTASSRRWPTRRARPRDRTAGPRSWPRRSTATRPISSGRARPARRCWPPPARRRAAVKDVA